jgi:hypothetical protein
VSTEHQITKRAADGSLTIADLREFLAQIEQTADSNHAVPKVRSGFSGTIKSISVTIPGEAEQR